MTTNSHRPEGHPPAPHGRVGVLLVNLGTPDDPSPGPMRRYLREFLSDRRVIEVPPLLWQPLLNLVILPLRARKSGAAYAKIWNKERDESPLRVITRDQAVALAERLETQDANLVVDWAMRYARPGMGERLRALAAAGCERILVFALYPQYSATTTATAYDEAFRALMRLRWQPALRTAAPYHDDPGYIEALAAALRAQIDAQGWEPEVVLASFHGIPQSYFDAGDPYYCHCMKTARLLREAMGWDESKLRATFQSRFGPQDWLQPYTDETLEALPRAEGVRAVTVITPGFAADCLETLEEIGLEGRDQFLAAGGERYSLVPCLNDDAAHIDFLEKRILRELAGWCEGGA